MTDKPGETRRKRLTWWRSLWVTVLHVDHMGAAYEVEVDLSDFWDKNTALYRDGVMVEKRSAPAKFRLSDGARIEVATSWVGIKRARLVTPRGKVPMAPIPGSWEHRWIGWHARNPGLSRVISVVSVVVLAVAAIVGFPQLLEYGSQFYNESDLRERVGVAWQFTSPINLPAQLNTGLTVAAFVAATERAWRLKYNPLLDGGGMGEIDF